MSDNHGKKRKRSKKFYISSNKRANTFALSPDSKGIFITCLNKEKECVREAYNLFNEYADKLYGPEQNEILPSGDCVEDDFSNEINLLKETKKKRRFQNVKIKAKNCIYIETQVEDPNHLVYNILKDLAEMQKSKTRHIARLLPVQRTCKAYVVDIHECLITLLDTFLKPETEELRTYAFFFKMRNNNALSRDDVLDVVLPTIREKCPTWSPDLKIPDIAIIIEIVQKMCFFIIAKEYHLLKKYNISEICNLNSDNVSLNEACRYNKEKIKSELISLDTVDEVNVSPGNQEILQSVVKTEEDKFDG